MNEKIYTVEISKAKPSFKQIFKCVYIPIIFVKVMIIMINGDYLDILPGVEGRWYLKTNSVDLASDSAKLFAKAGCPTNIY